MTATCAACGVTYDPYGGLGCPRCGCTKALQTPPAPRPIDPQTRELIDTAFAQMSRPTMHSSWLRPWSR